jgi:hypothetical protein
MYITPFDELVKEAETIQAFAEITVSDDMSEVVNRGNDLMTYIARTGKMQADAKYHLEIKRKGGALDVVARLSEGLKMSATVQNALIDSLSAGELSLYEGIERLNRTCTHQLDWCRTLVSKAKEEMRMTNIGKEFNV